MTNSSSAGACSSSLCRTKGAASARPLSATDATYTHAPQPLALRAKIVSAPPPMLPRPSVTLKKVGLPSTYHSLPTSGYSPSSAHTAQLLSVP